MCVDFCVINTIYHAEIFPLTKTYCHTQSTDNTGNSIQRIIKETNIITSLQHMYALSPTNVCELRAGCCCNFHLALRNIQVKKYNNTMVVLCVNLCKTLNINKIKCMCQIVLNIFCTVLINIQIIN